MMNQPSLQQLLPGRRIDMDCVLLYCRRLAHAASSMLLSTNDIILMSPIVVSNNNLTTIDVNNVRSLLDNNISLIDTLKTNQKVIQGEIITLFSKVFCV